MIFFLIDQWNIQRQALLTKSMKCMKSGLKPFATFFSEIRKRIRYGVIEDEPTYMLPIYARKNFCLRMAKTVSP